MNGVRIMQISDLLSRENVLFNARISNKKELLETLGLAASRHVQIPAQEIVSELLKREAFGSTGMGDGVAIPHARFASLEKPVGVLAKLRQPIDFEAVDGQPVDLVFLLLLPVNSQPEGLSSLACVARKLRVREEANALRHAQSADDLFALVTNGNKEVQNA